MFEYPETSNSVYVAPIFQKFISQDVLYKNLFRLKQEQIDGPKLIPEISNSNNTQPKITLPPRNTPRISAKAFARKIKRLEAMGFPHEQCIQALNAAFNNIEKAAEYLISGNIPSSNFSTIQEIEQNMKNLTESSSENVKAAKSVSHQGIVLTDEDKHALKRIESFGYEKSMIIQTYFACGKDETLTHNCLLSIGH